MLFTERRPKNMENVRYRVCVSRRGSARELTHLAQIELLRRCVASSGLPAATDKRRKRPRPKLAFGPAIAKGYESLAEYFDLELLSQVSQEEITEALDKVLDGGYKVEQVRRIPKFFPSLDSSINVVRYEIYGCFPKNSKELLKKFLSRSEIVIEKIKDGGARIEHVDARPLIIEMKQDPLDTLHLTLRFGPKRTVKPEAILAVLLSAKGPGEILKHFDILRKELLSETARGELMAP